MALERLDKYEIRRELGRGAMGVVYEGFDPLIERVVALKTILPDQLAGANATEFLARFRREALAAGRLSHPNIVAIYDYGEDSGIWYIAMERVEGRELADYFNANERFGVDAAVRILTQILDALAYSHQLGVVHRDIKPSNIFILPNGTAKIADFGIAHIESSQLTQVGTVLGTPAYMAPEQILGMPVDGRADLFAVGVMLYQFLTGERPFTGDTTVNTMRKVLEQEPLPPSRFNVQIPGAMDAVVRRALAKKPEERFQTAQEFAAALAAAAKGEPGASGDTTLAAEALAGAATVGASRSNAAAGPGVAANVAAGPDAAANVAAAPGATAHATAPTSGGSQRAAMVVVGAVVALAVGAGIWFALQGRGGAADGPARAVAVAPAGNAPTQPSGNATVAPSSNGPATPGGNTPAAPSGGAPASTSADVPAPAGATPAKSAPGALVISAVGLVDPSEARYQGDPALMQSELRADSRGQLVEKAIGLLVEPGSVAKHYDALRDKVLAKSGTFVTSVVRESAPQKGKDGLVSITTEAVIDVKAVQKSLNEMSRDDRIDLIRASGDPRVGVRILTRDADAPGAPAQPSPVADNVVKERIKSFGFRTWSADAARSDDPKAGPDFMIEGEAKIKRLSMKLPASGLVVTKYALSGWTIKCVDRATSEEIYYNTKLPAGDGSWASEEAALKAIGTRIAAEFSRDFFLQHVYVTGRRVVLKVDGVPASVGDDVLTRELVAMPTVINIAPATSPRTFDLQVASGGPAADAVAGALLKSLNAKLGQPCFAVGAVTGEQVGVTFDARCNDPAVLGRLETNPPAALYGAPPVRQKAVVKNPDTLKKLLI